MAVRLVCRFCKNCLPCYCPRRSVHYASLYPDMEDFLMKMSQDPRYSVLFEGKTLVEMQDEIEKQITFKTEVWVPLSYRVDGHHVLTYSAESQERCLAEVQRMGLQQLGFFPVEMGSLPVQWSCQKAGILEKERLRQAIHYLATLLKDKESMKK